MKTPFLFDAASSRRTFFSRALKGGTIAAALGAVPFSVQNAFADTAGDIAILNYALTLEHLEHAFYRDQLARFNRRSFNRFRSFDGQLRNLGRRAGKTAAARPKNNGNGNAPSGQLAVYDLLLEIRDHEAAHVQTLTQTIQSLGGTPVPELTYNFGVDDANEFLRLAQTFENTGVSAYDGAIALIESPELQTAGATIATVEARHASFLNLINGDDPFPAAFDPPKSMAEVTAAVAPFIVG